MAEALKKAADGPQPTASREGAALPTAPSPPTAAAEAAGIRLTPAQLRARRARSIAIALALGAFVVVIFAVTIVRLGSNVLTGPDYMRPQQTTK